MTLRPIPPPPAASLAFKAHVSVWAIAGMAAALYLGWMVVLPTSGSSTVAKSETAKSDRSSAQANGEVYSAMVRLAQDVRALDGRVSASDETSNALASRMAALEERTLVSAAAAPSPAMAPVSTGGEVRPSDMTTGGIAQRTPAPAPSVPAAVPGIVLAMPAAANQTATGQPVALAPAPPSVAAPAKALVGIQLSSASNLDALRLNWSLLNERHRATLGPLQTRYRQAAGKPNAPYQLIAGPIRSPADAARICKELAGTGIACRATTFTGDVL